MEFVGKALLLDVSKYQVKNEESGVLEDRYKYSFLVGDQKDKNSYIENAHVETCLSKKILLLGDESVFDEIDIVVHTKKFKQKIGGVLVDVERNVYDVVDKVGE